MGSNKRLYADIMAVQQEVTASCNIIVVKLPNGKTIRIIVDCGLFHEKQYEGLNGVLPFKAEKVDFCLVTHNHVDHVGRLPFMVKKGYSKKIYATESTCKLLPLALYDCFKVLKDVSKRKNEKCLYNEINVRKTLELLKPCKYNQTIELGEHVKATFFENGHLMGAALILIQITYPGCDDINILFTGDYNNKNMFFDVNPLPKWVLELPLTVVQEATYGDMESKEITKCFKDNVKKYIEQGKSVLALVFSLERAQEILYELKTMQKAGQLEDIPIYLDGKLARRYTELYLKDGLDVKDEMRDFLPENLTYVDKENREEVLENTDKKIILTTSGMGSYGPAQVYIPEYLKRSDAVIHFTGYTAVGTLGNIIQNTEEGKNVQVGGLVVKKHAKVESTAEYSAHAKSDEMIGFLNQFKNLKLVLVNHGETEVKEKFADKIVDEVDAKNVGLLGSDYLFRINSNGFEKTLTTKFY